MNDTVEHLSAEMAYWQADSLPPRSLMGGTQQMRIEGETFLPKSPLESQVAYDARKSTSTLLNAFRKTVSFLSGQVFQSDIIFSEQVEKDYKFLIKNTDTLGNDIHVFSKRVFAEGLAFGASHILIDMPVAAQSIYSVEGAEIAGVRPYFKFINPMDVLGYITSPDGFLEQVRLKETILVRDGIYSVKKINRVRVLRPGSWVIFTQDEKSNKYVMSDSGTFSVDLIPMVSFLPGQEFSPVSGRTPLMDLADLNLKHWRSASHQDNILRVARSPLIFGKKIDLDELPDGLSSLITSDDMDADLKFIEHSGKAIAAGRTDLKDTENAMSLYGLQQLVSRAAGAMTATEKILASAEAHSSIKTWAIEAEAVLIKAFTIAGMFIDIPFPDDGLRLDKDYLKDTPMIVESSVRKSTDEEKNDTKEIDVNAEIQTE